MSTTTNSDVVVRIYEISATDNGRITHFTVSLSMTVAEARITDREGEVAFDEVWQRVEKVMLRDSITGQPGSATFIRERLIPAAKANRPGRQAA